MTGDNQHQPKTADEILETEEEAIIRFAIERSLRQDAAEHCLGLAGEGVQFDCSARR